MTLITDDRAVELLPGGAERHVMFRDRGGNSEVDVDLLEACTEYNKQPHVQNFCDVLRHTFSALRGAAPGCPGGQTSFVSAFRLQAFQPPRRAGAARVPDPDTYLPIAFTCFFILDLPTYSSKEVMTTKLRYAIHNCQAIDADDTTVGRSAASMGWEV